MTNYCQPKKLKGLLVKKKIVMIKVRTGNDCITSHLTKAEIVINDCIYVSTNVVGGIYNNWTINGNERFFDSLFLKILNKGVGILNKYEDFTGL